MKELMHSVQTDTERRADAKWPSQAAVSWASAGGETCRSGTSVPCPAQVSAGNETRKPRLIATATTARPLTTTRAALTRSNLLVGLAAATAALVFAGGCASSPPMRFYTLSEVSPSAASPANAAGEIRVTRVRLPGELDRNEMVQRIDANQVRIVEQDRWAAPLDEMIRRVLAANLQSRGGGETGSTLSVDIDEFIGDASCKVTLRAAWELKGPNASTTHVATGKELISVPAPAACSVASLPAQMSTALAELSDRVLAARR